MEMWYPWLDPVWHQWQKNLESGRFSNASLLIAESGMGAEWVIERVSQALMCSNYNSEPCGFCHSCQLMKSNTHPDFHRIEPEKEGKSISVDQIRQCNRFAQESSQLSGTRVIVISPADAMNESAANALLKTLETPSEHCVFLLLAHQSQRLLPTIISRCQQWHIAPPSANELGGWLSATLGHTVGEHVPHINGLSPLKTRQFIEQKRESEYQAICAMLINLVAGDSSQLIELAKKLSSEGTESLAWLWYLLVDAQKVLFSIHEAHCSPQASELANQASYDLLYTQSKALEALIKRLNIHTGLNKELMIINWLTKFEGEACL